jgi:hypothetical protein
VRKASLQYILPAAAGGRAFVDAVRWYRAR